MNRKEFGNEGERVAEAYLKANGFKIVERNFRCRIGEIDIIARKGGDLYFVEVKARRGDRYGDPLESITLGKQRQLIKIAKYFVMEQKAEARYHLSTLGIRFDPDQTPVIRFIPDAFECWW